MTEEDYDEKLAIFLGNLACGDDRTTALAQGIAWRAVHELVSVYRPGFSQRLAQRLTPDDPKDCPPAAELPEDLRARLKTLAERIDQRPLERSGTKYPPPTALSQPQP